MTPHGEILPAPEVRPLLDIEVLALMGRIPLEQSLTYPPPNPKRQLSHNRRGRLRKVAGEGVVEEEEDSVGHFTDDSGKEFRRNKLEGEALGGIVFLRG